MFRIEDTDAARDTQESYDTLLEVDALARLRLGRGPRGRRPARAVPAVRAPRHLPRRRRPAARGRPRLRLLLLDRGARGAQPAAARPRAAQARVRRPLPRPHRRAGGGATGPRAARRCCGSGCRTGTSRSTTWCAARSPSSPSTCPTTCWCAANGHPLYTLVNPVDDALMEITHVLRGEDLLLLDAAPDRALRRARRDRRRPRPTPRFGHLPYVMGQGNKKLSKRDPRVATCSATASAGFLPEGLLNYLALLGWAIAEDRDIFSMAGDGRGVRHRAGQPEPGAVRPQEGRGDQRRAPARLLDVEELAERMVPYLQRGRGARRRRRPTSSGPCSTAPRRWCTSG